MASKSGASRSKHYEELRKMADNITREEKVAVLKHHLIDELPKEVVMAEACRRSLFTFLQEFWPTINSDPFVSNWHIPYLCAEIEGMFWRVVKRQSKEHDMIINVPPGTSKSTIVARMFPVWAWLNFPGMNIITGSYSSALSLDHADKSRDIMNSEKFKAYFPWLEIRPGQDTKSKYQIHWADKDKRLHLGGMRYSTSVGGTVTGMHGHIIIIDDPLNPAQAASEADRDTANKWVSQTLSVRKSDKANTPILMIMQRLHQDDCTGAYMKMVGEDFHVKLIRLPGEIRDGDEHTYPIPAELAENYVDGLLDPTRLSRVVLQGLMAQLGQFGYAGQIDQHPIPPGGGMFQTSRLLVLPETPLRSKARRKLMYWDKAGTVGKGDYTVGLQMWEMGGNVIPKYVIVKIVRGQWEANERERRIKEEASMAGRDVVQIVEQEGGSGGKESAQSTIRGLAGFSVKADRPTGSKQLRADVFSVQVNAGNVGIVNGPWISPFIEEMEYFPFSKHDDQVDAASGAFNNIVQSRRAGAW